MRERRMGELFQGCLIQRDEPMSEHTTFRTGGNADWFVTVTSAGQLQAGIAAMKDAGERYFILGGGSNTVFADAGYRGIVLCTRGMTNVTLSGETLTADCGAGLPALSRKAADNALAGLEFLSGVPGTVGGAVRMNAGCYDSEVKDVAESVTVLKGGAIVRFTGNELNFSYRRSGFLERDDIVLSAEFRLRSGNRELIHHRMRELNSLRRIKQPLDYPSAGSAFKRPKEGYAAAYIEQAGLKGKRVGGAAISEKHAGFLVNLGGAKSEDILKLIDYAAKEVYNRFNVILEPEIVFVPEK